ncbi:glucose dehydrogenase [FAD, quinone]-like [Schistocerca nitens]|uniref:glucose dehydrogenase [FAD, quinone]-like n=1 Tax=Schistocerca nitens TaxID=7011 RepID=UPI00211836BF|nr:glucose dehydrogenase [FAD, quinone]-like [Schistocerca nitens]XP_049792064.1 glucose dehydrogenase [FAD, quinone]-like [Schistocerca nitens]XP_049792065.1 glucose dehydrogenase [FAD, quinone]-like [Schistocerca nitens]XP_049792066.1 glucose dehydrogenase [FAD, quinone]-like [Schistocerca nitens]
MEVLNASAAAAAAAPCATYGVHAVVYSALLSALVQMTAAPDEAERRSYPADAWATGRLQEEYDWLVVGGGAAGSALAARLADHSPAWSVLLLDAGGDPQPEADVPRLFPRLHATQMDWQLRTDPERGSCEAYGERGCPWSRARVLGGSSTVGPGLYHRASRRDFDRWAQPEGCQHWAAEHMLRAFKDVEDYQPADAAGDHHGVGGELAVESFAEEEPLLGALLEAVAELNQSLVEDLNAWPADGSGGGVLGFGLLPGTVRNGTRWNAARAFLRKPRHNLHVLKNAQVTKVLIDPETMTALGVQYERDGEVGVVRASREVVLSAGAVGTAQLLMLSGLGPADHLHDVGVPLLKDLPVGYNLQDHVTYRGLLLVEEFVGRKESSDAFLHMAEAYEYLLYRAGPLSSPGYHSLAGFIRSGEDADDDAPGYPDVGIFLFGLESRHREWILQRQRELGWSEEAVSGLEELLDRGDALVVAPTPLRPFSRGRVLLRGADPTLPPRIQPSYLQDPRDVDTMLAGIRFALQLGRSRAARAAQLRVRDLPLAACSDHTPLSESYWRCALPLLSESLHQPAGTARMGAPEDPEAVVDCRLRVRGVSRLRVADASVMPTIVSGPLDATSIAIGTKAADILAEDWE